MKSNITLTPIPTAFVFADQPLDWSIKLWGEGKEEFSADDWRKFYKNAMSSNYSSWNSSGVDQEHLFMAIREEDGKSEVSPRFQFVILMILRSSASTNPGLKLLLFGRI